ncbi:MAG: UDP-N-acetylmuramoyl-L-alanine--D-glutamate ligase [Clostridia bacterium]|nr:UDP-N-acetylmuramoyl-L-alanine--D-glutamate ligase [Clostridia bacterium]
MSNLQDALFEMFKGKRAILLGAGVSNAPLAAFLSSFGAKIEIRDKKDKSEMKSETVAEFERVGAKLVTGEGYLDGMECDYLFRSPGFRPDNEGIVSAVERGAALTSEMDLFTELCPAHLIGVTGSDGKSTTTTVIYEILKRAAERAGTTAYLGGNIGFPLLDRVCSMDEGSFVSCELSSFQLMTVKSPVEVAVITNITPNHLNWHVDMDEYIEAKANILRGAKRAVLNYGCGITSELGKRCPCPVTYFSKDPIPEDAICKKDSLITLVADDIVFFEKASGKRRVVMKKSDILIPGLHNCENYMAAIGATAGYATDGDAREVARTFGGVRHRFELVRVLDGVYYYNSSIDSSPTRTIAAISNLVDKPINLILGGSDKNIPYDPLAKVIAEHKNMRSVTVTGQSAPKILASLESANAASSGVDIEFVDGFRAAVLSAASKAKPGDAVLLSPASASFDSFPNFEVRGDFFKEIVNGLDK